MQHVITIASIDTLGAINQTRPACRPDMVRPAVWIGSHLVDLHALCGRIAIPVRIHGISVWALS